MIPAIAIVLLAVAAAMQAPPITDVLARLDAYLAAYEPRLSELVADEVLIQEGTWALDAMAPGSRASSERRRRRRIESEVAFIALPNDSGWLGFRHVRSMNGRAVGNPDQSLSGALASAGGHNAARALIDESARHNLGLARTTNLPNLPLELLHTHNRRRWVVRWDGRETIRGVATTRLAFIERMTPTIIRNAAGGDMFSVVKAWVDPASGQLLQAEVASRDGANGAATHIVKVEFTSHAQLDLLVPVRMTETFPVHENRSGTGVAQYSNYRRFQTSARIVPQP